MRLISALFSLIFSFNIIASDALPTASHVDVNLYIGKWYAITSLPQFFTRNCEQQTAEYALKTANSISVLNTCIKKNGKTSTITGEAVIVNPKTNAELIVTFDNFWTRLFRVKGDYTIIKLDETYSTVLVGSKDRKSLWLMARNPYLHDDVKKEYIAYAKSLGFDTDKLVESKF